MQDCAITFWEPPTVPVDVGVDGVPVYLCLFVGVEEGRGVLVVGVRLGSALFVVPELLVELEVVAVAVALSQFVGEELGVPQAAFLGLSQFWKVKRRHAKNKITKTA